MFEAITCESCGGKQFETIGHTGNSDSMDIDIECTECGRPYTLTVQGGI